MIFANREHSVVVVDAAGASVLSISLSAEDLKLVAPYVPSSAENAAEKTAQLVAARAIRETAINRLSGIAARAVRANDATGIAAACDAATLSLLNITSIASVTAAIDAASTKAAIVAEWKRIALVLATAAPSAVNAFSGLDV